jgi:hypothetical protein
MDDDDRVSLDPLTPTQALKALLSVDPADEADEQPERCPKTWEGRQCRLKADHLGPCQFDL